MFNIFSRNNTPQSPVQPVFSETFCVIHEESVDWRCRALIAEENNVELYVYKATEEAKPFYEIIFKKDKLFKYVIYHHENKTETCKLFDHLKIVLNNLNKMISNYRWTAEQNLRSIVNCLKVNSMWTGTHIASRLGWDPFIRENDHVVKEEINVQIFPDKSTPLQLAIQNDHYQAVKCLLDYKPDLDLLNHRNFSVLHFAALSTLDILTLVLQQERMFERIQWKNSDGCTALVLACVAAKFDNVFQFLKTGLTKEMLTMPFPKPQSELTDSGQVSNDDHKNYVRVEFTNQDFQDFDLQDIVKAGSPLHWIKHTRLLERLIDQNFDINAKNLLGETPLHVMVKRNRVKCAIVLLYNNAHVNSQNLFGFTPLHYAIKQNDVVMTQTLIVFNANIDCENFLNESARHLAAKEAVTNSGIVLFLLSSLGAKRCSTEMSNCQEGCSSAGTFEGRYNQKFLHLDLSAEKNRIKFAFENIKLKKSRTKDNERKQGANMLCLDGGGIRGMLTVQLLADIEKRLKHPIASYFKWMAGTSTGSFIVTFLTQGRSLKEIRNIYFRLKSKVLVGDRPYDTNNLEDLLRTLCGAELQMKDLKTTFNKNVIIAATLIDRWPMKLHLFRSYINPYEALELEDNDSLSRPPIQDQLVWKALRASSSAPTYFQTFGPFVDGALIANNPTIDALADFYLHNDVLLKNGQECEQLNLVLSLGTGACKPVETLVQEMSSLYSMNPIEINNNIRYMLYMIKMLLFEICNTDDHIVSR